MSGYPVHPKILYKRFSPVFLIHLVSSGTDTRVSLFASIFSRMPDSLSYTPVKQDELIRWFPIQGCAPAKPCFIFCGINGEPGKKSLEEIRRPLTRRKWGAPPIVAQAKMRNRLINYPWVNIYTYINE